MKVLITGGSGLLGQYLNIELSKQYSILTLYNNHNYGIHNSQKCDINNTEHLQNIIYGFAPDIIIHTACISNTKSCDELPHDLVYKTNVTSTENICKIIGEKNIKLIFTSTDLVYDGDRGSNLKEDSKLNPISFYAETKLMGEEAVKKFSHNYIIFRLSLLYGKSLGRCSNHFENCYSVLKNEESIKLFTDQYRSPLELSDAARMLGLIIEKGIMNETINFAGSERISRYGLIKKLCEFNEFDQRLLTPISINKSAGYKVGDVSMNINKLVSFGIKPRSIDESISNLEFG